MATVDTGHGRILVEVGGHGFENVAEQPYVTAAERSDRVREIAEVRGTFAGTRSPNGFDVRAITVTRMVAQYTDTHLGRKVVDQNGVEVGTVEDVRNGDLYVDVGPDADSETLSELNWDGTVNQQVHHLSDRYVSNITDTTVRLNV